MGVSNKQIGANSSIEAALLWDILKQLDRLIKVTANGGGGAGDVVGPAGATDNNFAAFDGGTGKLLEDSGFNSASFQPSDANLTAIAALTTQAFGLSLLEQASAVAVKTTLQIPQNTYRLGRYYSNGLSGASSSTQALANGTLRAFKWRIETALNFTEIISEVTTLAGATSYRIGVYTDSGGYPDQLVAGTDVGTYDSTGNGVKSSGAVNITLQPGYYWIALNSNGTPTLRAHAVGNLLNLGTDVAMGANSFATAVTVAFAYAAMPSTFTAGGTFTLLACPTVAFKAA